MFTRYNTQRNWITISLPTQLHCSTNLEHSIALYVLWTSQKTEPPSHKFNPWLTRCIGASHMSTSLKHYTRVIYSWHFTPGQHDFNAVENWKCNWISIVETHSPENESNILLKLRLDSTPVETQIICLWNCQLQLNLGWTSLVDSPLFCLVQTV